MSAPSDFSVSLFWQQCRQLATAALLSAAVLLCALMLLTGADSCSVISLRTLASDSIRNPCTPAGVQVDIHPQSYRIEACWQTPSLQLRYLRTGVWAFASPGLHSQMPAWSAYFPSLLTENQTTKQYDEFNT